MGGTNSGGKRGCKLGEGEGVEVAERDQALDFWDGKRGLSVHCNGMVVRNVEVEAGDVVDGNASGSDQIQNVAMVVCGEVDVLLEVAALE